MKLKKVSDYEVLYKFEDIPGVGRMSYSEAKAYAEEHYPGLPLLLELTTSTLNIMPLEVDGVDLIKSFIRRLNITAKHHEVLPQLFDAGYIPFIFPPKFMMATPILPDKIIASMRNILKQTNINATKFRGAYFVDGYSTVSEWITRKDAAKIINIYLGSDRYDVENPTVTDTITTTDVYNVIFSIGDKT